MKKIAAAFLLLVLLSGTVTMAQETIGPWMIEAAPVAASEVTSQVDPANWLNVVDAPVTIFEAFTGFSIIDDGFANRLVDTVFEVSFAAPIENVAGPDLVLFDARFDDGTYAVSSDFDGFALEVAVDAFIDSGETRNYFYGNNPGGPFPAAAWGAEIDLTSLGLPLGGQATSFRIRSTNTSTDLLGLGALTPVIPVELTAFGVE